MKREQLDKLTNKLIGLAIEVHKQLGPGFVEKVYQKALGYEFCKANIKHESEVNIKVKYKTLSIGYQRVDFIIEDSLILELKSVTELNEIHLAQMISYLKTAGKRLGLILNFAKPKIEIRRVANNY